VSKQYHDLKHRTGRPIARIAHLQAGYRHLLDSARIYKSLLTVKTSV